MASNNKKVVLSTAPEWLGLGDVIWFIPTIKKLYNITGQKIDVVTQYPQIFKNLPYVENVFSLNTFDFKSQYGNHFCFQPLSDYYVHWFCVNNKQFIANKCGFSLTPEEEEIEFFPDKKEAIDLPSNYVFLNASVRGPDRDIGKDNWQKLINNLNDAGIPVVVEGFKNHMHDLQIRNGLNLCGETTSLSRTWHLINDSSCFVTFDTGMYILAGTTQTQIFLINSYFDNQWHKPYRNGSYDYKLKIIDEGKCSEKCIGNLKYYQTANGFWQPKAQTCALNKNFCCVPSVDKITEEITNHYFANKSNN
jgi:ADP-heptose:LPS heptosyltransferase